MGDIETKRLLETEALPRLLKRGRHGLSPAVVEASQRLRLIESTIEVVAEHGYAGATVAEITDRAGVSRRTFYQLYPDKAAGFIEAYQAMTDVLFVAVTSGANDEDDWPAWLWNGLEAFLNQLAVNPSLGLVYTYGVLSANERVLEQRYASDTQFIRGYRAIHAKMRASDPRVPELTEDTVRACIGVTTELIRHKIRSDGPTSVNELLPAMYGLIVQLLGMPVLPEDVTAEAMAQMRDVWFESRSPEADQQRFVAG